jgi:hypothetical protein
MVKTMLITMTMMCVSRRMRMSRLLKENKELRKISRLFLGYFMKSKAVYQHQACMKFWFNEKVICFFFFVNGKLRH